MCGGISSDYKSWPAETLLYYIEGGAFDKTEVRVLYVLTSGRCALSILRIVIKLCDKIETKDSEYRICKSFSSKLFGKIARTTLNCVVAP